MAKRPRSTFADIVAEVAARPSRPVDVRPGGFNRAGQFFDQTGHELLLAGHDISEAAALAAVSRGATLLYEGCGCGGATAGCHPSRFTEAEQNALVSAGAPIFTGRHGAPSWIDEWANERGRVVFLHGDYRWGDLID